MCFVEDNIYNVLLIKTAVSAAETRKCNTLVS